MQTAADLRRRIRRSVETLNNPTIDELVADLTRRAEVDEADVVSRLDEMEQHGFVYIVPTERGQEVRVP